MRVIVKLRVVTAVLLMLGTLLATVGLLPSASAATLYVGGAGPGNYTTIQGAIDAASAGDTVFVYSGIYTETVSINKTISLVGEDKDSTTIDGDYMGDVMVISADSVNISGLTIASSAGECYDPENPGFDPGIRATSVDRLRVTDNIFRDHECGIYILDSDDNVIEGNVFQNISHASIVAWESYGNTISNNIFFAGISLTWSGGNLIDHNLFQDVKYFGIFGHWANANMISNNTMPGTWVGINFEASDDNVIIHNNLTVAGVSIRMWASYRHTIVGNILRSVDEGGIGLVLEAASGNEILENTIADNFYGIVFMNASYNTIFHNNFINNKMPACVEGWFQHNNSWSNGYPSGGNYWTDFSGPDEWSGPNQDMPGEDGIRDRPVLIADCWYGGPSADNKDEYPLVEPYTPVPASPTSPLNLQAEPRPTRVVLKWTPPMRDGGSPVTNYIIYRGPAAGPRTLLARIGNVLTYADFGLNPGETYCYTVSAENANGEGRESREVCARLPRAWKVPPENVRVPKPGDVELHWGGIRNTPSAEVEGRSPRIAALGECCIKEKDCCPRCDVLMFTAEEYERRNA